MGRKRWYGLLPEVSALYSASSGTALKTGGGQRMKKNNSRLSGLKVPHGQRWSRLLALVGGTDLPVAVGVAVGAVGVAGAAVDATETATEGDAVGADVEGAAAGGEGAVVAIEGRKKALAVKAAAGTTTLRPGKRESAPLSQMVARMLGCAGRALHQLSAVQKRAKWRVARVQMQWSRRYIVFCNL